MTAWVRIATPTAVGGVKLEDGVVIECAPVFQKRFMGKRWPQVKKLCRRHGYTIQEIR